MRPGPTGDVAEVEDSVIDVRNIGLLGNKEGLSHGSWWQAERSNYYFPPARTNVIETVDRVVALMPYLQSSISPAIATHHSDGSHGHVRASVKDIETTLISRSFL